MTECEQVIAELLYLKHDCLEGSAADQTLDKALALLKAQETMVRCKDCMYWKSNMLTHFWKPCDVIKTDKDWYCPCGKRR